MELLVEVVEQVRAFFEVPVVGQKHCRHASTQGAVVEGVVSGLYNLHLPPQLEKAVTVVMVLVVVKPL